MPESITIPRSAASAERRLTELGALATATEWRRAAIVAAYVKPDHSSGGRREVADNRHLESARAFARRGIVGLTNHETVLLYARAWLDRFERPGPGRRVDLPTEPWPPTAVDLAARNVADPERRNRLQAAANERGVGASKVLDVASNPRAVAVALDADPEFRASVDRAREPDRHGIRGRQPVDAGALDATQSVDYRLTSALRDLHSSIVGLEMALRPFADRHLIAEVPERIRAEHEALGMLLALAEGIPNDVSAVTS